MSRLVARGIATTILAILATVGRPNIVFAQCVEVDDPHLCRLVRSDTIVFEATVDRIEGKSLPQADPLVLAPDERLVYVREVRPVQGAPQEVLVSEVFGSEDCSYRFRVGRRYLVVAERRADGRLTPSDLTRPVEESAGVRAYVADRQRAANGGQAWGFVSKPASWTDWDVSNGPVSGSRVTFQGPVTRSMTTAVDGQYRFTNLPFGTYEVRVDLARALSYLERIPRQRVSLDGVNRCAEVNVRAFSRSRIDGLIVNEGGAAAPNTFLMLHPADYNDPNSGSPGIGVAADRNGRYEFSDLPPGRYIVGVNTTVGPMPGFPYAERYALTADGDAVVTLEEGAHVTLQTLRLTRMIPFTLTGSVVTPEGTPLAGAQVSLWWSAERGASRRTYPIKTDATGRFEIPAWRGIPYVLEVGPHENPAARVTISSTEPLIITVGDR
jgi:protocatechuate 3,4-dioxygenase beta subunit